MKKIIFILGCVALAVSLSACTSKSATPQKTVEDVIVLSAREDWRGKVSIPEAGYNSFLKYINYDGISCPYSELFGIERAENEIKQLDFTVDEHCSDFFAGEKTVNPDKLIEVVKANNSQYISQGAQGNFNKELSDKMLRKACETVADTVNWGIENIDGFDFGKIGCILGNLKILEKNSYVLGSFNDKTYVLALTPDLIKNKKVENADAMELTIAHEAMHLMQCYCPDVAIGENDSFIGMSYTMGDLPINPLSSHWLFEASAELNTSLKEGIKPTTYIYMIDNLETISLAKILNQSTKPGELEKFSFAHDRERLYEYLEFSDENKAKEFVYAVELLRQKPDDFKAVYEEKNGAFTVDYKEFIKDTYTPYFVEVTSKLFYKNLAKRLADDEIPLGDVFYLISLYEMDLLKDLPFDNKTVREQYLGIYEDYLALQDEFFTHIESDVDVKEAFSAYCANYTDGAIFADAELGFLEPEKRDYLLYRNQCLYDDKFINLSNIE